MSSALKPVLTQGVPQPGGQASPAKANVANANHAVGLPQGAQNSMHHGTNNLVGQNLTHHAPAPPAPAHPVPSMAPVTANMAQMAQNMSHHGNLSHVTQNSVTPTNMAASPNKSASTSAPLSLVADKPQQPLALTRSPEKKDPETPGHANGTVDSPKSAASAPAALKPQNPEPNKEKQDIAKTSPSTPKPPEKPTSAPATQKSEPAVPVSTADGPTQPKVATANEAPEKSPSKPSEPKPAPTADVAPTQSDSKPVPESANDSQLQEKAPTPQKTASEPAPAEPAKVEIPAKVEEKKEEPKVEKPTPNCTEEKEAKPEEAKPEKKEEVKSEPPKKEEPIEKEPPKPKPEEKEKEKPEEKKPETPKPAVKEAKTPKSTLKLATVTPPMRKRRHTSPKATDGATPAKKLAPAQGDTPDPRSKRSRTQVQLYQSPTPELAMATKLSASAGRSTPTKPNDDKLIVFYKNEYLAVRNAEGGFYVCQTTQNVYRTTRKIKIRWLSQDKSDLSGETYKPDFYDVTDMECVLTTLSLTRAAGGGGAQTLKPAEAARASSILQRALRAESGAAGLELTEEHPDGLDLSLYTDESQLEKKSRKRGASKGEPRKSDASDTVKEAATPAKKARTTPKRSPKSAPKAKPTPPKPYDNKRKSTGSAPIVASTSKTATAVTEKAKGKSTPKRTPVKAKAKPEKVESPKVESPATRKGRRSAAAAKENKPSPAPVPSTSTGKTTRTPRKPPAKK